MALERKQRFEEDQPVNTFYCSSSVDIYVFYHIYTGWFINVKTKEELEYFADNKTYTGNLSFFPTRMILKREREKKRKPNDDMCLISLFSMVYNLLWLVYKIIY